MFDVSQENKDGERGHGKDERQFKVDANFLERKVKLGKFADL